MQECCLEDSTGSYRILKDGQGKAIRAVANGTAFACMAENSKKWDLSFCCFACQIHIAMRSCSVTRRLNINNIATNIACHGNGPSFSVVMAVPSRIHMKSIRSFSS